MRRYVFNVKYHLIPIPPQFENLGMIGFESLMSLGWMDFLIEVGKVDILSLKGTDG